MAESGYVRDRRCAEALDLLEAERLPDGGFPAEGEFCHAAAAAAHAATNLDAADTVDPTGEQLIDLGLLVVLAKQPDTAPITCRRRRESLYRKAHQEEAMAW